MADAGVPSRCPPWLRVPATNGSPDYERLINVVHDAAINAGIRLCGPFAWRERPDFTCFQNQQQTRAIATGVRVELGELWNTTGKGEAGPWADLGR